MRANPFFGDIIAPRGPDNFPTFGGNHKLPGQQSGVVLFIALIVLVAMTLAGIALVRSVDTGNVIAGNLAFKQGATLAGDAGTEAGITWLQAVAGSSSSYNDQPAAGYYATSQDTLDMTGSSNDPTRALVDWDFNSCNGATTPACITPAPAMSKDAAGDTVTFIIHRLCQSPGDPNSTGNSCANYKSTASTSPKKGELKYGDDKRFEPLPKEYYRITSRTVGPRNTVSF
ncbi:MAG: pilus assembly PilX family protein, partial [Sulfuricella sp.]